MFQSWSTTRKAAAKGPADSIMAFQLCRPIIYVTLAFIALLNVVIGLFTPVHIVFSGFAFEFIYGGAAAIVLFALARTYPDVTNRPFRARAIGYTFEAVFLAMVMILSLRGMDQISKVFAPPYADGWLIRADQMLRLDWLAYFTFIHDRPYLHLTLDRAYLLLELVTALTALGLLLIGRLDRSRLLLESFIVCAVISLCFGAVFPAQAAVATLVPDIAAYSNFVTPPGVYHLEMLDALRDPATTVLIGENPMPGLVTFPSLHTANGILLILACWRTPLFWPAFGYSVLMIAATPVWGGHYIIDLIAGAGMAGIVGWLLGRQQANAGIWRATRIWPNAGLRVT